MFINFKTLRYKNFLSTGNIFTEIALDSCDATICTGGNGAGKSSVYESISYVLYNKPIRNVNLPQLVNNMTQKDLLVEIEFETNQNHYMISRGMKPAIFEIYKDGVLVNQDSEKKDYQTYLEKTILRMNHKSFKQIVLLSSTNFTPFMQLPPNQRREIVEDLLDIQIFSVMNSLLKTRITENKDNLKNIDSNIKLIQSKIELNTKHLQELQSNNTEIITEKQNKIAELQNNTLLLNTEIQKLNAELEILEEKRVLQDKTEKSLQKLSSNKNTCHDKLNKIEKEIKFYSKTDECPVCQQSISDEFKKTQLEKKAIQQSSITELLAGVEQKYYERMNQLEVLQGYTRQIKIISDKVLEYTTQTILNNNYIADLEKDIKKLNKKNKEIQSDNSEEYTTALKSAETDKILALEERELYNVSSVLLKDGGIKSQIIKQYIPTMNKLISKYLLKMEFDTIFEITENFSERICTRYKDNFSYDSFSQGQKMRIDIALMLTWREISKLRNSVSTNLLLLDEFFDNSLDDQGNEDVLYILKTMISDVNLFIISHKFDMVDKFDRVIEFRESGGFSRIV